MKVNFTAGGHMEEHPDDKFLFNCCVKDVSEDEDYCEIFSKVLYEISSRYCYFFELEELTLNFCHDEEL